MSQNVTRTREKVKIESREMQIFLYSSERERNWACKRVALVLVSERRCASGSQQQQPLSFSRCHQSG